MLMLVLKSWQNAVCLKDTLIILVVTLKDGQKMAEAKKSERANAIKEVKRLCKEFGFTAGMLKGALAEGRAKK